MEKEFDYSPTFLGGLGSVLDYKHRAYLSLKSRYEECLSELREMSCVKKEAIVVNSWTENMYSFDDPFVKLRVYKQITGYINLHSSEDWEFSHIEEEEWEDFEYSDSPPKEMVTLNLFAFVKKEDSLKGTQVYKETLHCLELLLKELKDSEESFIEEIERNYIRKLENK